MVGSTSSGGDAIVFFKIQIRLVFRNTAGSSEYMRLTSTGLGIGTSSPAYKLDVVVASNKNVVAFAPSSSSGISDFSSGGVGWNFSRPSNGGLVNSVYSYDTAAAAKHNFVIQARNDLVFTTDGDFSSATEKMRLDSSGNLGLGVTPSAFATVKAMQLNTASTLMAFTNEFDIGQNVYYNAGNKYITTGAATLYAQTTGQHQWFNAPSGTAGNAISFTQAMTLDASGRLGIGTSSPDTSTKLTVAGAITVTGANSGHGASRLKLGQDNSAISQIRFYGADNSTAGILQFTGSSADGAVGAERARITSGGYFKASNSGTYVGLTSTYHELVQTAANTIAYFANTSATAGDNYGINISYRNADPNGTGNHFIYCEGDAVTQRMSVRSNGGIANYSANDVNLSDRREKTNFAPAKSYLDTICAIPVQTFNYIDQNMEEDPGLTLGVVAQDVQAVAPELVMESNWGTEEEPKMRLSIYQTDLQYALMKCIQEQQAIIEQLQADVATLKGTA
jgi:hypothetical protein